MSTRPPSLGLVADRRIREDAVQKAPQLDVRGPISQAMQRAGVDVAPQGPVPSPSAPLSGLTADERRVHQILLDALAMNAQQGLGDGTGISTLSYAEKMRLAVLDLEFIDAELAKMNHRGGPVSPTVRGALALGGIVGAGLITAMIFTRESPTEGGNLIFLVTFLLAMVGLGIRLVQTKTVSPQRKKIYEALRELALVAHPDVPVSDALMQADRLIDRLALGSEAPTSTPRQRVRS